MEGTPHVVAHFMAAGAEKRLEDYHYLRNTYETISGQEVQLNRILRMLGEEEFNLSWRGGVLPVGRARNQFPYDFDRVGNTLVLHGSMAYERLRELEHDAVRSIRLSTPGAPRRVQELRERRRFMSEQRELSSSESTPAPSAARLRALAEYDAAIADSEAKRRQQAEENMLNKRNNKDNLEKKEDMASDIELIAFTVRCHPVPSSNKLANQKNPSVRLQCQWASPSSSSSIDHFTIERQIGNGEWVPVGDQIGKSQNRTQLDMPLANQDENQSRIPSHFRLKAHLRNGQTFTSKPTNDIDIYSFVEPQAIIPDVEILSSHSVQLTWQDDNKTGDIKDQELKTNLYNVEMKEHRRSGSEQQDEEPSHWEKVTEVPLSQQTLRVESLDDATDCDFRLIPSTVPETVSLEDKVEPEPIAIHDINQLLSALHVNPTSSNTVNVNVSEDGFQGFDSYKVEYTTADQPDQWQQVPKITRIRPQLTIDYLQEDSDYKFRFTPVQADSKESNSNHNSQISLVIDVKMPPKEKPPPSKVEKKPPATPPQFSIQPIDEVSVLIEATVPNEEPATFDDVYDILTKKDSSEEDWVKVGTIDKDHMTAKVENLEENTGYSFKIDNITSPTDGDDNDQEPTIPPLKFETKSVKKFDPTLLLEKIDQSLESVVSGVMKAAAGHQTLEEPVNLSLNEVIRGVFRDESLVPNEEFGFDTLNLSNELQLYRGPKQMMLEELEVDQTVDASKHYGEIIIHNYRSAQSEQQSVAVREENGNTSVANIDGDVIIRNVVSDVTLINDRTRHRLSMNIVGQAFLKGVQGTLIASKFKGIIVVKNVNKP